MKPSAYLSLCLLFYLKRQLTSDIFRGHWHNISVVGMLLVMWGMMVVLVIRNVVKMMICANGVWRVCQRNCCGSSLSWKLLLLLLLRSRSYRLYPFNRFLFLSHGILLFKSPSSPEIWTIVKHIVWVRIQCPVTTLSRFLIIPGNLYEALWNKYAEKIY